MTRLWLQCRLQLITPPLDSDRKSVSCGIRARPQLVPSDSQPLSRVKQPCRYEMIGEMRMQMGLPDLALTALLNVLKLYPNRFNSIADAAAAAAAVQSSASPPSLSPTASSLYAQLLALAALAPSLRAASTGLPGKSFAFAPFHSIVVICIVLIPHPPSSSFALF